MKNYDALTDEQLVPLWLLNDEKAISELSVRFGKISLAIARGYSSDSEECADLSQEGMIGFLSAVYSYRSPAPASFRTYASCCIRNRILSALRKGASQKRVPGNLISSLEEMGDATANSPTPEELLISQKEAEYISALMEELLSDKEHKVLKLYLSGASYESIAKALDFTVKSVDSTLQRAKKKLREKLKNNF